MMEDYSFVTALVTVQVKPITESKLTGAQKDAIADLDVQTVYDIYLTSNNKRITDFGDGKAVVEVAHKAKGGQQPGRPLRYESSKTALISLALWALLFYLLFKIAE